MLLTLDTNVVWDALDPEREHHSDASILLELDRRGACQIAVVSRINIDIPSGGIREKFAQLDISRRPFVPTIGAWDLSSWDEDHWASEEENEAFLQIFSLVFPCSQPGSKRHQARLSDIGHLFGHRASKRDIFVTRDGQILVKKKELLEMHGVSVMAPIDAIRSVLESS